MKSIRTELTDEEKQLFKNLAVKMVNANTDVVKASNSYKSYKLLNQFGLPSSSDSLSDSKNNIILDDNDSDSDLIKEEIVFSRTNSY